MKSEASLNCTTSSDGQKKVLIYMYNVHCIYMMYMYIVYMYICIQWNPSNPDTIGPEKSVLISEVSLFQGLKSTHTWNLGRKNVSCLERYPYFRGVLIEGLHRLLINKATQHNSIFPGSSFFRGKNHFLGWNLNQGGCSTN